MLALLSDIYEMLNAFHGSFLMVYRLLAGIRAITPPPLPQRQNLTAFTAAYYGVAFAHVSLFPL